MLGEGRISAVLRRGVVKFFTLVSSEASMQQKVLDRKEASSSTTKAFLYSSEVYYAPCFGCNGHKCYLTRL
jgi:hypothetical protein